MTRGAALLFALGFAGAALLYGGVWQYGDGFIFNRFNGEVIYVDLPEDDDMARMPADSAWHLPAPHHLVAAHRTRHGARVHPLSARPAPRLPNQPSA